MNPNYEILPVYWKSEPAITILKEFDKNPTGYKCLKCGESKFGRNSNGKGIKTYACFKCSNKDCGWKPSVTTFASEIMKFNYNTNNHSSSHDDPICTDFSDSCSDNEPLKTLNFSNKRIAISPLLSSSDIGNKSYIDKKFDDMKAFFVDMFKAQEYPGHHSSDMSGILQVLLEQNEILKNQINALQKEIKLLKEPKSASPSQVPSLILDHGTDDSLIVPETQAPQQNNQAVAKEQAQVTLKNSKPSFADIAKRFTKQNNSTSSTVIQSALRKLAGVKQPFTSTKTEVKHQVCRVYIQGIQRQSIKEVKASLFELRFQLSKIFSIDFIGKMVVEFTIPSSYLNAFLRKINEIPIFSVVKNVDPSKPADPKATEQTKEIIKAAYIKRIQSSLHNSKNQEYKAYLVDLAAELNIPILESDIHTEYSNNKSMDVETSSQVTQNNPPANSQ